MSVSLETLEKLAQYDTPTICNAIELFETRPRDHGYMNTSIRSRFPDLLPMVGFAATVSFRASGLPSKAEGYVSVPSQIQQFETLPGPPVVVVQDLDNQPVGATFGEMMCRAYQTFGSVGLITSGAGRDLDQVRELRYPVFTGSTICSHGYCHLLNIGTPVYVGGLYVKQGELLHGDLNGVTTIPLEIASELADVAAECVEAERGQIEFSERKGEKHCDEFVEVIKDAIQLFEKIRSRVSRKQ
jgi:4-hydroxy-4-methyl-2-oxoglutarate aldolase